MQPGGFRLIAQGSNQENWRQGQKTKVGSMVTITVRVIMFEVEIRIATKTSTGVTIEIEMI